MNKINHFLEMLPRFIAKGPDVLGNYQDKDYLINLIAKNKTKELILVACMPKSASTFLTRTLSFLLGLPNARFTYSHQRNEQQFYLPNLLLSLNTGTVAQHHAKASQPNLELIDLFSIRVILLVRNIFDIVPSLIDHYNDPSNHTYTPMAYLSNRFRQLQSEEQINFIIDLILPWYFNFYVSWWENCDKLKISPLWITYEELASDNLTTMHKILHFLKIAKTNSEIQTAIESAKKTHIRFNKGQAGRGKLQLTSKQRQKIINLAKHYPWVDFRTIGIIYEK